MSNKIAELKGYVTALLDKYEDRGGRKINMVPLDVAMTDLERVLDIIEDTEKPQEAIAEAITLGSLPMEAMTKFVSRRFLKNE